MIPANERLAAVSSALAPGLRSAALRAAAAAPQRVR
jgi:hypothetical protein